MVTGRTFLTVTAAALRVQRSPRQIERWIAAGLPVYRIDGKRKRYVLEQELLVVFRASILANPTRSKHRIEE